MAAYTSLSIIKAELGVGDNSQDARLQALIMRASGLIDGYCGRGFVQGVYVEQVKGYGAGSCLMAKNTPLISITSIALDGVVINPDDYEIENAEAGLIRGAWVDTSPLAYGLSGAYIAGRQQRRYEINYIGGYVLPDDVGRNLPYEIEQSCIELVRGAYYSAGRDSGIKSRSVDGVGSITYVGGASMNIANVAPSLSAYRDVGGLL